MFSVQSLAEHWVDLKKRKQCPLPRVILVQSKCSFLSVLLVTAYKVIRYIFFYLMFIFLYVKTTLMLFKILYLIFHFCTIELVLHIIFIFSCDLLTTYTFVYKLYTATTVLVAIIKKHCSTTCRPPQSYFFFFYCLQLDEVYYC